MNWEWYWGENKTSSNYHPWKFSVDGIFTFQNPWLKIHCVRIHAASCLGEKEMSIVENC